MSSFSSSSFSADLANSSSSSLAKTSLAKTSLANSPFISKSGQSAQLAQLAKSVSPEKKVPYFAHLFNDDSSRFSSPLSKTTSLAKTTTKETLSTINSSRFPKTFFPKMNRGGGDNYHCNNDDDNVIVDNVRKGIINKGKSCYANVVMQLFASLWEWCPAFEQCQKLFEMKKKKSTCDLISNQKLVQSAHAFLRTEQARAEEGDYIKDDPCQRCLNSFFLFIRDLRNPNQYSKFETEPVDDAGNNSSVIKTTTTTTSSSFSALAKAKAKTSSPPISPRPPPLASTLRLVSRKNTSLDLFKLTVDMANSNCFIAKLKENLSGGDNFYDAPFCSTGSNNNNNKRRLIHQFFTIENDALEWFFKIVDLLYDHCSISSRSPHQQHFDKINSNESKVWMNRFPKFCPLVDCLYGLMVSKYQCQRCNHIFENVDVFQQLTIFFPSHPNHHNQTKDYSSSYLAENSSSSFSAKTSSFSNKNIENALKESFLKPELVESFTCQNCFSKNTTWVSKQCISLPDVLIVHFQNPCALDKHYFPLPDFSFDAQFLMTDSFVSAHSSKNDCSKHSYFLIGTINHQTIIHPTQQNLLPSWNSTTTTHHHHHHHHHHKISSYFQQQKKQQARPSLSTFLTDTSGSQFSFPAPSHIGHYYYQFKQKQQQQQQQQSSPSSFSPTTTIQFPFNFNKKTNRKSSSPTTPESTTPTTPTPTTPTTTSLFSNFFRFPKNNTPTRSLPTSPIRFFRSSDLFRHQQANGVVCGGKTRGRGAEGQDVFDSDEEKEKEDDISTKHSSIKLKLPRSSSFSSKLSFSAKSTFSAKSKETDDEQEQQKRQTGLGEGGAYRREEKYETNNPQHHQHRNNSWFKANDSKITFLKNGPTFSNVSSLIFFRPQSL